MDVLADYLSIVASIFAILSIALAISNRSLKRENDRLTAQYNFIRQDYSRHVDQIINIKKGDLKKQYDTEHLLRKSFPTVTLYVFLFSYILIGYVVGRNYNIVSNIISLFMPKIQLSNPEFWIVIVSLIVLASLPLYPRKRIIANFPYKAIELPIVSDAENSTKERGNIPG